MHTSPTTPRTLALGLWLLALAPACSGGADDTGSTSDGGSGDGGSGDGGSGDGGSGDGGGAEADPPELLAPDGDRVLVYTGHGGLEPQGTGKASFTLVESRWDALGYNLHTRTELPDDLTIYRLVLLVAPGSVAAVPFTADEVARLEAARAVGSRLVVLGDPAMCGSAEVGRLLADLGTGLSFTGDGADTNQIIVAKDLDATAQALQGVSALWMRDPCHVAGPGGAILARDDDGHGLFASELPADGGEVMVLGDLEVLDDNNLEDEDNAVLADNLARVVP